MQRANPTEPTMRILLVDDTELFRESLAQNLSEAGYSVTEFAGGQDIIDFFAEGESGDLILLDWKMPEMNGIDVLKNLREQQIEVPVVFLTALSDQIYEETALLGGAVDFVEKSRSFTILLHRINLILSRQRAGARPTGNDDTDAITVGNLTLEPHSGGVLWCGNPVDLTLTEFKIVDHLARAAGRNIPYREIYNLVRGERFFVGSGSDGYRSNVRAFIKRIRKKFRDVDDDFAAIETYIGFGYRWSDSSADDESPV